MKMEPDDYYNNGIFEIARFGTQTVMRNNMSPERHKKLIEQFKRKYPNMKKRINRHIKSLRKKIVTCNPVELLSFASDLFLTSNLGISSEFQLSGPAISISRITEYIQSVFVSTPLKYKETKKDPSKKFFWIQKNMEKLYSLIHEFYMYWMAYSNELYPEYDDETKKIVFEAQTLYTVRGQRYQVFEKEYFERLLKSHNEIFSKLFGISSDEIVDGIEKLQYALSQGKMEAFNDLGTLMNEFFESGETDIEMFKAKHPNAGQDFVEKFLGTKLRNVIEITGWPEAFVESLSFKPNEYPEFFENGEFAGWPIIDLPIQKRPFINIDNQYYCFDYYSFVDNFYRAIQKAISRKDSDYKWADTQKEASENMVSDVFSQILPGSIIHRDNYYPKNKSIKNLSENDIIIQYEDVLLIVEVKAGSFVFTPPITDFENHIRSYKSLIEKADHQCKNTYDYLVTNNIAKLYEQDGTEKAEIDMSKINDVYMISVTIDNINDFAARAEKMNFLQLKCNAISLSIDDLMVYREYFDSPLVFLHFLKQRRQATQEPKLALNDELDHLGLYIKHNMYNLQLSDVPDDTQIRFQGYREELDEYFCALYHPQLQPTKPNLKIPPLLLEILKYLEETNIENKIEISDYLLSFATDAKEILCDQINYTLVRQLKTHNMLAISVAGFDEFSLRYTCFVEQPKINALSKEEKREYVLSTMLWNREKDRVMFEFSFDKKKQLIGLKYKNYTLSDITNDEIDKLAEIGKSRALIKSKFYLAQNGEIQHNEICPCGSGRIYGDCCEKFIAYNHQ